MISVCGCIRAVLCVRSSQAVGAGGWVCVCASACVRVCVRLLVRLRARACLCVCECECEILNFLNRHATIFMPATMSCLLFVDSLGHSYTIMCLINTPFRQCRRQMVCRAEHRQADTRVSTNVGDSSTVWWTLCCLLEAAATE